MAASVIAALAPIVAPLIGKALGIGHKGGKVPKSGLYSLKQGEVVLNKTQQRKARKQGKLPSKNVRMLPQVIGGKRRGRKR